MTARNVLFAVSALAFGSAVSLPVSAGISIVQTGFKREVCNTLLGDPQRIAYVLGNAEYGKQSLVSPAIDADQLGQVLSRIGFTVRVCTDRRRDEIRADVEQWIVENKRSNVKQAVFFFSGHGEQVDSVEYIAGVDAVDSEPSKGWTALKDIANAMKGFGVTPLMLLDTHRPGGKGKTGELCADKGVVALYAATGDQIAVDKVSIGGDRVISPFSALLSVELVDDARPLNEIASHLRRTVSALVNLSNSITQEPELCDAGGHAKSMILNPKGRSAKTSAGTR